MKLSGLTTSHLPFGDAVLGKWEGIEFDDHWIADVNVAIVAPGDIRLDLKLALDGHEGDEVLPGLQHGADRNLVDRLHDGVHVAAKLHQLPRRLALFSCSRPSLALLLASDNF